LRFYKAENLKNRGGLFKTLASGVTGFACPDSLKIHGKSGFCRLSEIPVQNRLSFETVSHCLIVSIGAYFFRDGR
jgi:hypothetical protein